VLEEAELIFNERRGKHRLCRLNRAALTNAKEWLDFNRRFWIGSLDRLERHLQLPDKAKTTKPKKGRKT
jgi:hypothetical protein